MINQTTKDKIEQLRQTYAELSAGREHILHDIAIAEIPEMVYNSNAIGSNMFEGFEPTEKLIRLYLDYKTGKITNNQLLVNLKEIV